MSDIYLYISVNISWKYIYIVWGNIRYTYVTKVSYEIGSIFVLNFGFNEVLLCKNVQVCQGPKHTQIDIHTHSHTHSHTHLLRWLEAEIRIWSRILILDCP